MTIVSRGAPALLALLAGSACSSQTINILTPPGDGSTSTSDAAIDGSAPAIDAAIDSVADADASPDASPDASGPPDASGLCPEIIDQRLADCVSPPVSQCDGSTRVAGSGASAQVFTPGIAGAITQLRLLMRTVDPANNKVIVSIADLRDDPLALFDPLYSIDAHLLSTTLTSMTAEFAWQSVAFASPPTVLANHPYAIYVRMPSAASGSADWRFFNDFDHPTIDPYPGGRSFSVTSTGEWFEFALSEDFMFEVHVAPLSCP